MPAKEGDRWVVVDLMPGVRSVRFTQPVLSEDDEIGFGEFWERLLEDVNQGDVIILDFEQVRGYDSRFLAGLFRAGSKLRERGGRFIGCHLTDDLLRTWRVVGLAQPLEFLLNYVGSEGEAVEKARQMMG